MRIVAENPIGCFPRLQPELLPDNAAMDARNIRVGDGFVLPYRDVEIVNSNAQSRLHPEDPVNDGVLRSLYRYRDDYGDTWLTSTRDTDYMRGQVVNDRFRRLYWTDGLTAWMSDQSNIRPDLSAVGPYPIDRFLLGVLEPVQELAVNSESRIVFYGVSIGTPGANGALTIDGPADSFSQLQIGEKVTIYYNDLTPPGGSGTGGRGSESVFISSINGDSASFVDASGADVEASEWAGRTPTWVSIANANEDAADFRYYAISYETTFGERGPLKQMADPIRVFGDTRVTLEIDASRLFPANVESVLLWRTVNSGDADDDFHLVKKFPIADLVQTAGVYLLEDSFLDRTVGFNEVAPSVYYSTPPISGAHSMLALSNGVSVMAADNTLMFSPPYLPHTYPAEWHVPVPEDIVGLSYVGNSVIVMTTDDVYLANVTDPAFVTVESMQVGNGCVSKRSIVPVPGYGCIYASRVGAHLVGLNVPQNITRNFMRAEQWQELQPDSITGAYWENKYILFYSNSTTGKRGGLIIDFQRADLGLVWLDIWFSAVFVDPLDDHLYGILDNLIVRFDAGQDRLRGRWVSKPYDLDRDAVMEYSEVESNDFENLEITIEHGRLDNLQEVDNYMVLDDEPERLRCVRDDKYRLTLEGRSRWRRAKVAETAVEL